MEEAMGIFIELNNFEVSKRLIFLKAEIKYGAPNYSEIIQELKEKHEMTAEKIAHILPISAPSSITEWMVGGRPNYEVGEALIELWKTFTGKTEYDIPRVEKWGLR